MGRIHQIGDEYHHKSTLSFWRLEKDYWRAYRKDGRFLTVRDNYEPNAFGDILARMTYTWVYRPVSENNKIVSLLRFWRA